jgi:hypothetical protein
VSRLDTKPYVEPDPLIGYRYAPDTRLRLPRPGGGEYQIAINRDGIRSDREYSRATPPGTRRLIVLGDSMAAGQFVDNSQRFTEILERRHADLELINLALEGSGTDQQVLLYEHVGRRFEHDAVLLMPFLQNIRRNMAGARDAVDPATGRMVLRAKPRFELIDGGLVLHPPAAATGNGSVIRDTPASVGLKAAINRVPGSSVWKRALYAVRPWEPFTEYANAASPEWRLMAALIQRLRQLASPRPVVIVPAFYSNYVRYRMATNFLDRFRSLEDPPALVVIDLLPHFRALGADAVRCFQDPFDMHFSAHGHLVIADALQAELSARGLIERR